MFYFQAHKSKKIATDINNRSMDNVAKEEVTHAFCVL